MDAILSIFTGNSFLIGLGGVLAMIAAAFFKGRSAGKQAERDKQAGERLKARTDADKIDDAIAGRDPDANRDKLKEWTPWGKQ